MKTKFHSSVHNILQMVLNFQLLLYPQINIRIGLAYNFVTKELALVVILSVEFVA
jgi:hypothetical protein